MRIVWLSANKLGYELLKEAIKINGVNISAILTLKKNASTKMYDGIPSDLWRSFKCNVFEIDKINEEAGLLKKLSPDMVILCGWRQHLARNILGIPKNGFIGFHPTLLPYGRGPAPIINTILSGLKRSGLTMFYLTEGIDDGDIIAQESFSVNKSDYAEDIYNKIIASGKKIIRRHLPKIIRGTAQRIPQDRNKATVFPKVTLKDNRIDLTKDSIEMAIRKIRAFSEPYCGAYLQYEKEKLVIWRADRKK